MLPEPALAGGRLLFALCVLTTKAYMPLTESGSPGNGVGS